jgi:hypothetical protein
LRPATTAFYAVLFVAAALGWMRVRSWRGAWLPMTLTVLALTLVHAVYWSNMRMRAPIEPLLGLFAASVLDFRRTGFGFDRSP